MQTARCCVWYNFRPSIRYGIHIKSNLNHKSPDLNLYEWDHLVHCTMYQHKVDVDMLNAVKSVLADILSVSPLSEQRALFALMKG